MVRYANAQVWISCALTVTVIGCARGGSTSRATGMDASTASSDASHAPVDVAIDASVVDASPAVQHPTLAERKRYGDALVRGRAATVAKDWPAAIAAFGEALKAIPSDARALSERGYARLLSGDAAGAQRDLEAAINSAPKSERKLIAQIYFNLGLAAEKQGKKDAAGAFFRSSYEYNPTQAAKAKMLPCPVTVDTDITINSVTSIDEYDPYKATDLGDRDYLSERASDGSYLAAHPNESMQALLPKKAGGGYWQLSTGGRIRMYRSGVAFFSAEPQDEVEVKRSGTLWVVTVQSMVEGVLEPTCPCGSCKDGELVHDYVHGGEMKCEDSPFSLGEEHCIPCGGTMDQGVGAELPPLAPGGSREVFYVDADTGAPLWHVTYDSSFNKKVVLRVDNGNLHVTGAGCNIKTPRPDHPTE